MAFQIKGKSIEQLSRMSEKQFARLSAKNQRLVASRLVSAANKRIRRIENAGLSGYLSNIPTAGSFSIKGVGSGQIPTEFSNLKQFLTSESTTLKGTRKVKKKYDDLGDKREENLQKLIEELRRRGVKDVHRGNIEDVLERFRKLKEVNRTLSMREYYYQILETVRDFGFKDEMDVEEMLDKVNRDIIEREERKRRDIERNYNSLGE